MKSNVIKGVGCIVAACAVLYACQKDLSPSATAKPSLSASSTNVATGEKVALTLNNSVPGTHVVWSSNAGQASFSSTGQGTATVSFSKPGTYTVSAFVVSGAAQDSVPILYHPYNDTVPYNPYDTVPHNPYDTVPHNPYDTVPYNPYDTVPHNPYDTVPYNPYDTVPNYPHDTTPHVPTYDTIYYYPDSTYIDSVTRAHNGQVITVVTIVIIVH